MVKPPADFNTADMTVKVTETAPQFSEEDPRARAARRAAELRDHGALDVGTDEFAIDQSMIPAGWTYEYKMHTVLGKPDPSYEVFLKQKGWEPVPRDRHPELMPIEWKGNTIERKGQILMEIPTEIYRQFQKKDRDAARELVTSKEQQMNGSAPGTFERVDGTGAPTARIKKSFEPGMSIPDK
jgi:hypothetical protein